MEISVMMWFYCEGKVETYRKQRIVVTGTGPFLVSRKIASGFSRVKRKMMLTI